MRSENVFPSATKPNFGAVGDEGFAFNSRELYSFRTVANGFAAGGLSKERLNISNASCANNIVRAVVFAEI